MTLTSILSSMPTYTDAPSIEDWAEQQVVIGLNALWGPDQKNSFVGIKASDIPPDDHSLFQQFINAALLADWMSYSAPADRAEYPRLNNVIRTFPRGFRLWLCQMENGQHMPVGYTGWYPLSKDIFDKIHDHPEQITHRGELVPQSTLSAAGDYLWIFNYSILKPLQKSEQSRRMLQTYAADIKALNPLGLAAAVISEESKAVVRRLGLHHVGNMTHTGVSEEVWATRLLSDNTP